MFNGKLFLEEEYSFRWVIYIVELEYSRIWGVIFVVLWFIWVIYGFMLVKFSIGVGFVSII